MRRLKETLSDVLWFFVLAAILAAGALFTNSMCNVESKQAALPIYFRK